MTLEIIWRETWPRGEGRPTDNAEDYVATYQGKVIGRVYNMPDHPHLTHPWKWFARFPTIPNSGDAMSRYEAMLEIETRFEATLPETTKRPPAP